MRLIRVFPRRTKATPMDGLAFVGNMPNPSPEADVVHVSCTFSWDKPEAERLAEVWGKRYHVELNGPAYDHLGDWFIPGRYLKFGYTITSRGCPHKCWFCFVPQREGKLRLLPIMPGWDVIDNNILATPKAHQLRVFSMLARQPKRPRFTGGLEAALLTEWFVHRLAQIGLDILYLAYDRPDEKESVAVAAKLLKAAGFSRGKLGCYVLVGYAGDTIEKAQTRLLWVCEQGITPFAMYYRDEKAGANKSDEWNKFVRLWCRPAGVWSLYKQLKGK